MKFMLFLAAVTLAHTAAAREWTKTSGAKAEAEFAGLEGGAGNEKLVLRFANGKSRSFPLTDFSQADQAFARQSAAQEEKEPEAEPSIFKEVLKEKLVILRGQQMATYEVEAEPTYYAFYFSAHWCPPCRAFTPALADFYNQHPGRGRAFEIIFVSDDSDAAAMVTYMKEMAMPWPAVGYKLGPKLWQVRKYRGAGIPCLVVVDRQGKVLSDSYRNGEYVGPMRVLQDLRALTLKAR